MKREVTNRRHRGDSPSVEAEKKVVRFDVWLQRASLIAQTGLFVLTLGTLYFTVIPLYQKALLDEEIAKKQVLLEQTQADLAKAYIQVRKFTINRFVADASAECAGLLEPPDRDFRAPLDIDPARCLNEELIRMHLDGMHSEDEKLVRAKVADIAAELAPDRAAAMRRYDTADTTVRTRPLAVKISARSEQRLATLAGTVPESVIQTERLRIAADDERLAATTDYVAKVISRIGELRMIRWTDSKPNNG